MTTGQSKIRNFLYALAAALFIFLFLWVNSAEPPYGPPNNELSNQVWGILVNIGHKWRDLSFSFWDRGVGGGSCLYSSGFYPVFHPTNALALLLNDGQFFKFKTIEPYVVGVFFAVFVLLQVFRLRLAFALFGGLLYMGLGFGRFATIADAQYFLWGAALFPLLVYVLAELRQRHWASSAALAGSVLAVQFLLEGAPQFIQLLIWGLIFLTAYLLFFERPHSFLKTVPRWMAACFLFLFFAVGLAAVQFLPTFMTTFFDSARPYSGQYAINNFPLYDPNPGAPKGSVLTFLQRLIVSPGGVSWRIIAVLWLIAFSFSVLYRKEFKKLFEHEKFLTALCVATALYFFVPTVAGWSAALSPFFAEILKPFSFFTFAYSVHIIDFCMMLWLVFMLDHGESIARRPETKRHSLSLAVSIAGLLFLILPLLLGIPGLQNTILEFWPQGRSFVPVSLKSAFAVLVLGSALLGFLYFHPRKKWMKTAAYGVLVFVGFLTMFLSFKWNDKGDQSRIALYHFATPEIRYYQHAQGKYYLPVADLYSGSHDPDEKKFYPSGHNFNLLFDVHGTSGFLQVPPLRFNRFLASYHSDRMKTLKDWWVPKLSINDPGPGIPSHFPVDFTTVKAGEDLGWPGFFKKVQGEYFDVWERTSPVERVYFAQELRVVDLDHLIAGFDQPRTDTIYISTDEAPEYNLDNMSIIGVTKEKPQYSDFHSPRADMIQFAMTAPSDTMVVVPEIFADGWDVKIDGKVTEIFPADFLFVGFSAPKGTHQVAMQFIPPFLQLGSLISAVSLVLLALMLYRFPRIVPQKN